MAQSLLLVAHLKKPRIAFHKVADDHICLDGKLPVRILFLPVLALSLAVEGSHRGTREQRPVLVVVVPLVRLAVFLHPGHCPVELLVVVDAEIHAAQDFHQGDVLRAHTKVVLKEVGVNDGAGDAHTGIAHTQVALASHSGDGLRCTRPAEYLLRHVGRDAVVREVLNIVAIDAVGRETLLGVSGEYGGKVHRTRALRSVEAPYGLRPMRMHIHSLRTVAPAGSHGNGGPHTFTLEFVLTRGSFRHATYGGIGNHALDS